MSSSLPTPWQSWTTASCRVTSSSASILISIIGLASSSGNIEFDFDEKTFFACPENFWPPMHISRALMRFWDTTSTLPLQPLPLPLQTFQRQKYVYFRPNLKIETSCLLLQTLERGRQYSKTDANLKPFHGTVAWLSWYRGRFRRQRSAVRIQSLANF